MRLCEKLGIISPTECCLYLIQMASDLNYAAPDSLVQSEEHFGLLGQKRRTDLDELTVDWAG